MVRHHRRVGFIYFTVKFCFAGRPQYKNHGQVKPDEEHNDKNNEDERLVHMYVNLCIVPNEIALNSIVSECLKNRHCCLIW
jgi:hypothetical protein